MTAVTITVWRNPLSADRIQQVLEELACVAGQDPHHDMSTIFDAYNELEVGGLIAGDVPTFRIDHMPYGGIKDSGLGREGLRDAIQDMTEPKLLVMNLR